MNTPSPRSLLKTILVWLVMLWLSIGALTLRAQSTEPAQGVTADAISATTTQPQESAQPQEVNAIRQLLNNRKQEWLDYPEQYFVQGHILVGMRTVAGITAADSTAPAGLQALQDAQLIDVVDFSQPGSETGTIMQQWRVPVGQEWTAIAALQDDASVLYAEPNWIVQAVPLESNEQVQQLPVIPTPDQALVDPAAAAEMEAIFNTVDKPFSVSDPLYLDNQWYLQRINASRAWAAVFGDLTHAGLPLTPIRVAVIDSGIDVTITQPSGVRSYHPEFLGRMLDGKNYCPKPNEPLCKTTDLPIDGFGHGTHVAGLLAATLNNATGIASMAPFAIIDPIKVLDQRGSGEVAVVAKAIKDAADSGARIINLSLEIGTSSATLKEGIDYAAARNVLMVAAAGNRGALAYPAAYESVIAVAALTYDNVRASYSGIGAGVDIAAPGGELLSRGTPIYSTWSLAAAANCKDGSYRVIDGGAYCNDAGTSMSAPLVSGVAALIWGIRPSLTVAQVRAILSETATPIAGTTNEVGAGRLDAHAAVRRTLSSNLQLSPPAIELKLESGAPVQAILVRIDNPSLQAIDWSASVPTQTTWLSLKDSISNSVSGTVRYGDVDFISVVVSPTHLLTGTHYGLINLLAVRGDGTRISQTVTASLAISTAFQRRFLPVVYRDASGTIPPPPPPAAYSWEKPISDTDRVAYSMSDSGIIISFPPSFTFSLRGRTYGEVRIYPDGFVTFPGAESAVTQQTNRCLPDVAKPGQAIYGWWTNLDPAATGATVSTFPLGTSKFVIEYSNVPVTVTVPTSGTVASAPAFANYSVSFQIVLYKNGNIGLNYRDLPIIEAESPLVTVGVEGRDGLLVTQIACTTATQRFGTMPQSRESYLIRPEDIF